ncbi:hypothetical protein ACTOB_002873 [Actinoplanes oblitus]|uniref:Uncharacterized protein n=1 Tax=Actinoplanes oblitus TaxID=3040509 RepID=A0ABY8WP76_9ACTN|nr:hypothetical protein [Actinoplanes oblitus]WIM99227.1 hypothetical protein ACTOB_002873 [Actinoplanes oblitus]
MVENNNFAEFAEFGSTDDFLASIPWQIAQWTIFGGDLDGSPQGQELAQHVTNILTGMQAVRAAVKSPSDGSGVLQ